MWLTERAALVRCGLAAAAHLAMAGVLAAAAQAPQQYRYPFQDPSLPIEQRVSDIVSRMTLDEKIANLGTHPGVPRLGIKGSGHIEGLHGLALGGPGGWGGKGKEPVPTTTFPQARGLGSTWDPALIQQVAAVEGYEARYAFQRSTDGRGGIVVRAPNADLSRDPRWGRSEESYGEDPFLVGTLVSSFVRGLQGNDPKYWQAASLLKHFLANSNEDGRGGSSSNFDERLFQEYYAAPFRMGIEQGGARAMMTSYNAWNRIPMTANPVLKSVVEKQWGFDGILCTDAGALTNMVTEHHYSPDIEHAAASAIHAGINQFLDDYQDAVRGALKKKLISEADIDEDLRGVFRVMIRLGLLDPPEMVPYASISVKPVEGQGKNSGDPWTWASHRIVARAATDESIVLLKNENGCLPLDPAQLKSVVVIGRYADQVLLDWYSGTPPYGVSPLDGIRNAAGSGVKVAFNRGDSLGGAASAAKAADVAIVVVGNHPTCDAGWNVCEVKSSGKEGIDRKSLTLEEEDLVKRVYAANPRTIVVLIASFPYSIDWTQEHVPAILTMTHNSQEEGNGLADVLFGRYNPSGRLTQTWPASMDQLPPMMDYDIRHGRTYMYAKSKPLYAFGYGLSYTSFAYSGLRFSKPALHTDGAVAVYFTLKNTGSRAGDEVAQLYVSHTGSKVERPLKELKAFTRVRLGPGESKEVGLLLKASDLAYWDVAAQHFQVEQDQLRVMVGGSSDDPKVEGTIPVVQ